MTTLERLSLYYNTLKHLTATQVMYQVYNKVKPKRKLQFYMPNTPKSMKKMTFGYRMEPYNSLNEQKVFTFLNLSYTFENHVDWSFDEHGKLWNYNLQYLNFLNQSDLSKSLKLEMLYDISKQLSDGNLQLEPYPVSLRGMNILRYYSQQTDPSVLVSSTLYGQFNYLSKNLEFHLLGNHLLENAFALMMAGYCFNETKWITRAKSILTDQLNEQILKDGGHFELSPMYHQIILFRVLELIDWYSIANNTDHQFIQFLRCKAIVMLKWLKAITFTNGEIPHFNDSAPSIAPTTAQLVTMASSVGIEDVQSGDLRDSGFRKLIMKNFECVIDVGEIGASYQPGHAHSDALSFVINYKQKPFIVEVGTSTYQVGPRRNYERSTEAHNTVVVNATNQSEVWGGFRVAKRALVEIVEDLSENRLKVQHDGYRKNYKVIHERSFDFSEKQITVLDNVGEQTGHFHLHFHPHCKIEVLDDKLSIEGIGTIVFDNASTINLQPYSYSNGFNNIIAGKKIIVEFKGVLTTKINLN